MPKVYDNATPQGRDERGTAPGFMEVHEPPVKDGRSKVRRCKECGKEKLAEAFPPNGANARICNECLPTVQARRSEVQRKRAKERYETAKAKGAPERKPKVDPVKSAAGRKGKEAMLEANPHGADIKPKQSEPVQGPKATADPPLVDLVRAAIHLGLSVEVTIR